MADFWYNHFNVFLDKGADRYLVTAYERDVIRPHALGKFEDLLVATAKSPAMLFYLDNWQSVGPDSRRHAACADASPAARQKRKPRRGLQRKLRARDHGTAHARRRRRLHAEGCHRSGQSASPAGPSSQPQQAALQVRWSACTSPEQNRSRPQDHGGRRERSHGDAGYAGPASFHRAFHFKKLAMRFVADDPPPALVDRMAKLS